MPLQVHINGVSLIRGTLFRGPGYSGSHVISSFTSRSCYSPLFPDALLARRCEKVSAHARSDGRAAQLLPSSLRRILVAGWSTLFQQHSSYSFWVPCHKKSTSGNFSFDHYKHKVAYLNCGPIYKQVRVVERDFLNLELTSDIGVLIIA